MKTRLIALLVAMSLSLHPCWAAEDDEEKENENGKQRLWGTVALVFVGGLVFFLPELITYRRQLKKVGNYGEVHVKGLHHHFTTKQADTILRWRSTGDLFSYKDNRIGLEKVLIAAARYGDHDILDRVVKLTAEHGSYFIHSVTITEALGAAIKHDHINIVDGLLKLADKQDAQFLSWDIASMFELATKHKHIDIAKQVLAMADRQNVMFSPGDIASMFELATKHKHIDIAKQVLAMADRQNVMFSPGDIASMFELATKHKHIDIAKQVLAMADRQNVMFSPGDMVYLLGGAAKLGHDDIQELVVKLAKKQGIDPDNPYGRTLYRYADDYTGDPYEVLGVSDAASSGDIKHAFRQLTRKHHPDKLGKGISEEDKATAVEKFREVVSAYEELRRRGKID